MPEALRHKVSDFKICIRHATNLALKVPDPSVNLNLPPDRIRYPRPTCGILFMGSKQIGEKSDPVGYASGNLRLGASAFTLRTNKRIAAFLGCTDR